MSKTNFLKDKKQGKLVKTICSNPECREVFQQFNWADRKYCTKACRPQEIARRKKNKDFMDTYFPKRNKYVSL